MTLLGQRSDLFVGADHDSLELGIHIQLIPEERLQALHPLEIADRHAARIGKNIWYDGDPAILENRVGIGRCWAVRALHDHRSLNAWRVQLGELVFQRGWD